MKRKASTSASTTPTKKKPKLTRQNATVTIYRNPSPISPEKKAYDINGTTYQINTTGSVTALCTPQLGTDLANRVGRRIKLTSVYIRGDVGLEAAYTSAAVQVHAQQARFILFMDYQPNGIIASATDLLTQATSWGQLNLNNRERFKVLKDKTFVFDNYEKSAATDANWGRTIYNFKCFKKLDEDCVFNSNNLGTIGDIQTGALYMLWIGSLASGANTDGNARLTTRVRFIDA